MLVALYLHEATIVGSVGSAVFQGPICLLCLKNPKFGNSSVMVVIVLGSCVEIKHISFQ